jgi:hypothetical protein
LGFASRAWPTCPKPWLHKRNTTPPSPRVGSRSKPDGSHASRCRCVREGHARSSFAWCENSDALLYSPPPLGATHAAYAGGIGAKTHTRFGENSRAVRALTEDRPRVSVSSSLVERAEERSHPTGRERMVSPTLRTLQEPILLLPWVCFRGGGFPNPCSGGSLLLRVSMPEHSQRLIVDAVVFPTGACLKARRHWWNA